MTLVKRLVKGSPLTAGEHDGNLDHVLDRTNHTGSQAQATITNLTSDLAGKAPLASPALTGTPTAPTAAPGTNTTQIATTAFVQAAAGAVEGTAIKSTGEAGGSKFLREDGDGTCSWQAIPGGGDALTSSPLSQFAATTSAQLAGVVSDETGSGALVFATSPTLITPTLGTPASGTLTNCTGLPATGISNATAAGRAMLTAADATAQTTLLDVVTSAAKGLAPASGGGTTNFLRADGTWAAPPGGGASGTSFYNGTGATLTKGTPVCLAAFDAGSGNPGMAAADADGTGTMPCLGILGADVANGASGIPVIAGGEITGLDTSAWTVGDTLYVSATTGALTNTRPATGYVQPVAIVSKVDATTGEIIVAIGAVGQLITALTLATSIDGTERFPISGDKALTTGQMIEKARAVDYIAETTTARTLSSTDNGKVIGAQNAGATVITIPANGTVSLPVGFTVHFTADTDATVTIDAETGVSLNGVSSGSTTISTKYRGVATAHKTATDTWFIRGDCAAVA